MTGLELRKNADTTWQCGDWRSCLDIHLQLLRNSLAQSDRRIGETEDEYTLLERLCYLAPIFGQVEAADLLLAGLGSLYRERGLAIDADRVTLQRTQLALGQGRLPDAYQLLDDMRPTLGDVFKEDVLPGTLEGLIQWESQRAWLSSGDRVALFCQFYLTMGRLARVVGKFSLARLMLSRGLQIVEANSSSGVSGYFVPFHLTLSESEIEAGDLRSAGGHLALISSRIDAVREPGHAVQQKELWATIHMLRGEFGAGLDLLLEVPLFLRNHALLCPALRAQLNLARAKVFLLQTAEASQLLVATVQEAQRIRCPGIPARAKELMLLADFVTRQSVRNTAASVHAMRGSQPAGSGGALNAWPSAPSGSFLAHFEMQADGVRASLGAPHSSELEWRWREMTDQFDSTDSVLVQARMATVEAEILASRGEFAMAAELIDRVVPVLRSLGLKAGLSIALWLAAGYRAKCGGESVDLIEESHKLTANMARSLPAPEREMFLLGRSLQEETWLDSRLEGLLKLQKRGEPAAVAAELDQVISHIEAHQDFLHQESLRRDSPHGGEPAAGSFQCSANRAVVMFVVLSNRVFTVCYRNGHIEFLVRPVTRQHLREMVARWHVSLQREGNGGDECIEIGKNLAADLGVFELLDSVLAGLPPHSISELIFIPDDSLHGFPFASLRIDGRYLIERYAISIAHRRPATPAARGPVAVPLLAAAMCGTSAFQMLSGVNDLNWLAEELRSSGQLPAAEMNSSNLQRLLPGADLLHIVCHGTFECDRPELTGLVPVPQTGKSELLSLTDIAALDLRRLQHATLVACCAADNYILPGHWVLGVAEVFRISGADSVLASLWEAFSDPADRFVKAFYKYLRDKNRNEALRLTQLDFLRAGEHPEDWCGWQLYGDTGPLKFAC